MKVVLDAYLTSDRMPEPHKAVLISGGPAYHNGSSEWFSLQDGRYRCRRIVWPVLWWIPIPTCEDISELAISSTPTAQPENTQ